MEEIKWEKIKSGRGKKHEVRMCVNGEREEDKEREGYKGKEEREIVVSKKKIIYVSKLVIIVIIIIIIRNVSFRLNRSAAGKTSLSNVFTRF